VVIARSWWNESVGDEFGGVRWSIGGRGFLGRDKSLSYGRHQRGDAHEHHHSFLKGTNAVYPFPTPLRISGEALGPVYEITSSSHPFLKMLLGMRRFRVQRAWWEFFESAAVTDHHRFRRLNVVDITFFSSFFVVSLFFFFSFELD
jgi:hypothetical protein